MTIDIPTPEVIEAPTTYGRPDRDPVLTVRVHPDDNPADPNALRVVKVAVASRDEWPWRRVTGLPTRTPSQGTDLATWPIQPLGDAALALGHDEVLTGRVVG